MKLSIAVITSILLSGCTDVGSKHNETDIVLERYETKISDQFNICARTPRNVQVAKSNAVDAENVSYKDARSSYDITFNRSSDDLTRTKGPMIGVGGPLDVLVFGTLTDEENEVYLIAFDSPGSANPRTLGSVKLNSGSLSDVEGMFTFISSWDICDGSPGEL